MQQPQTHTDTWRSTLQRGLGVGDQTRFPVTVVKCTPSVSPAVAPVTFDELSEALAGAAVVEREARLALLLHAEARRLHFGEGEAKVLVQVVQLIDEVAHISPQNL